MLGSKKIRKRKADDEDDLIARPTARPRQETIIIPEDEPSAHESISTEDFLQASAPTTLAEDTITNPDPDVEAKLQEALDSLLTHKRNIFITGPAGSGKSYVIKGLVNRLEAEGYKCTVLAFTGAAALNVGGQTCHSFFGLTPNITKRGRVEVVKHAKKPKIQRRLQKTKFLFIDEVSLISHEFMIQMSSMFQEALDVPRKPFGGVQTVITGDFCQLAPVKPQEYCIECGQTRVERGGNLMDCPAHGTVAEAMKWAFTTEEWRKLKLKNIFLTKILRQMDERSTQISWDLWLGNTLSPSQVELLSYPRPVTEPTLRLFMLRREVEDYNKRQWKKLNTPRIKYDCWDRFVLHNDHRDHPWIRKLADPVSDRSALASHRDHKFAEVLRLRQDMPVILLHNISIAKGLVNGSMGVIVGFEDYSPSETRTGGGGMDSSGYSWDDEGGVSMTDYVPALGGGQADWRYREIRKFGESNGAESIPVVKFSNGHTAAIRPECIIQEVARGSGISLKIRVQIPLASGFSATVHRSQGLSFDRVVIDYASAFEYAQYYVGISRARTIDGLRVQNLNPRAMTGHPPEILAFMREILPDHIKQMMRG